MSPLATAPPSALARPVETLPGVGQARAKHLAALGIKTLADLLAYFPRTYLRESEERDIPELVEGEIQSARGEVTAVDYVPGRRPRFAATLSQGTHRLSLVFFNAAYLRRQIHPGISIRVRGAVQFFHSIPQMVNPKWEVVNDQTQRVEQSRYQPVYPATASLTSEAISRIIAGGLPLAMPHIAEWYGTDLLERQRIAGRPQAFSFIHQPADEKQAIAGRRRLVFDELMLMQLGLGLSRRQQENRVSAPVIRVDKLLDERIRNRFAFSLTQGQQAAIWQMIRDFKSGRPMHRLLQGDVGSGKTVVAVYGMLAAVANRLQAAILAPTEVLAEQHFLTISNFLAGSSVNIGLFTQRTKKQSRNTLQQQIADGSIHLAIGTQALLQEDIDFANLGLVVVDEQHRLGVRQRASLKGKGVMPHYLVMTATPIPRTLALSFFADFDVSTIDELPPGRHPITTRWLTQSQIGKAYDFVKHEVAAGRQAFIVVPQVEEDLLEGGKSVATELAKLAKGPLKGLRLAGLHGKLDTADKQAIMQAFRARETDVLIATTVIEVGIDVPNATVIIIDNAERFGLSQLHQLRGRVGRGAHESHCLLISDAVTETARARITSMTKTQSGFEIAELDLQLRGPGEFFGLRQHGLPEFKLADISSEIKMLEQAKAEALTLLEADPSLTRSENRAIRMALTAQFGTALGLAQIG